MSLVWDASPVPSVRCSPALGAVQRTDFSDGDLNVHHEANCAGQDTGGQGEGDGQCDIGRSFRAGTAMPPTVLVTELESGELVIQGRPDGPRVRLSPSDAPPLRWELAAAFERAEQASVDSSSEAQ